MRNDLARRTIVVLLLGSIGHVCLGQTSGSQRTKILITDLRSVESTHRLTLETHGDSPTSVVVLVLREREGFSLAKDRERRPAQAKRVGELRSDPGGSPGLNRSFRWEGEFYATLRPEEIFAIVCSVNSRSGWGTERDMEALQYSIRSARSIEDVLKKLYEFDWRPAGYTRAWWTPR
jgi:hypothetical protein